MDYRSVQWNLEPVAKTVAFANGPLAQSRNPVGLSDPVAEKAFANGVKIA